MHGCNYVCVSSLVDVNHVTLFKLDSLFRQCRLLVGDNERYFHCLGFPSVKLLFRKLNATLPSSAPVERLFCKVSLISLPRWNRLNDLKFEELLLLKANSKLLADSHCTEQLSSCNTFVDMMCTAAVTLNFCTCMM